MVKIVNGPFGQNNMHLSTLDFCQDQTRPTRKELNVPKLKSSSGLTVIIILWLLVPLLNLDLFVKRISSVGFPFFLRAKSKKHE